MEKLMAKKTTNKPQTDNENQATEENQAPTAASITNPQATASLETIGAMLMALGHLDRTKAPTYDEVLATAQKVLLEYNSTLRNAGIMLHHTLTVYESMADRGVYPEELVKDSSSYKGRTGLKDLKAVLNQIVSFFPSQPAK